MLFRSGNPFGQFLSIIVRPDRADKYTESDLGMKSEVINGVPCVRDDMDIANKKGQKMKCSFYHFNDNVSI